MNVLHVTPGFFPAHIYGGPIESVYQLCLNLGRLGCSVQVLTTDANGRDTVLDVETDKNVTIDRGVWVRYCHRIAPHTVSPSLIHSLPSFIRWAHVVHLTSVYSFPTLPTLALCKLLSKPVVWSPRGSLQRWEGSRRIRAKSVWDLACRSLMPQKTVIHTTSEQEARQTGRQIDGVDLVVIPNGVLVPEETLRTTGNNLLRLLYVGRLHPQKGIENLLKACGILKDHGGLGWALTIAGSGKPDYESRLRDLTAHLALDGHVNFVGDIRGDRKRMLFEEADVLVLPSYNENFGLVVAEALAHGVPVVVGKGAPWAAVEEHGCGLWVENSPRKLATAISMMKENNRLAMGARGRAWMKSDFDWRAIAKAMFSLYQQMLEAPHQHVRGAA